jgi:hypothetical protein
LILWNTDVIQLVSLILCQRNLQSLGVEPSQGVQKIEELIEYCSPSVVVFDLEPPYSRSSAVVLNLLGRFPDPGFVFTCADPPRALKDAPWLSQFPMLQKPYTPDQIGEIVTSMKTHASNQLDRTDSDSGADAVPAGHTSREKSLKAQL